jgi:predicted amidohydrolase
VTRIVCCQVAPRIGDLAGNRERTLRAITEAVAAGGEIVVLPELSTSGYVFASRDEAASVAITGEDDVFSSWAEPPVVETPFGRIGVLICYDLEFPELTRAAALRGADLLVVPTNWPRVYRPPGERPPEVVIAMAAARTNRIFIACCDRVGTERGQEWTGGTVVIDEQGWLLATATGEGTAVADVDLLLAREKALSPLSDVFGDRRPELYAALGAAAGRPDASIAAGVGVGS